MSGTASGGKQAASTNKKKYGADFYIKIGSRGGSAPYTGKKGFAKRPELASEAGRLGGATNRRRSRWPKSGVYMDIKNTAINRNDSIQKRV